MSARGVLVTSYDRTGKIISRSSAVSYGDLILLPGYHLMPLLERAEWKELFKSILPSVLQNAEANDMINANIEFMMFEEENDDYVLPEMVERVGRRVLTVAVWKCPLVKQSLEMFTFDGGQVQDDSIHLCLSLFVLLKIPGDNCTSLLQKIANFIHIVEVPVQGRKLIIESTPGGMQIFINSWSSGAVSRVYGKHSCMFLTDATVHSECAGAPVYNAVYSKFNILSKGSLLGLVFGRIGDLSDFTWVIALLPVLRRIVPGAWIYPRVVPQTNLGRLVDQTVVMISSGNLKGSGVVIDGRRGVVLTCSHVIQNDGATVKIHHMGNIFTGDVVYSTRELDLAVVIAPPGNSLIKHMDIAESPARKGDIVYVAGFPDVLPCQEYDVRPFISLGCISKSLPYVIVSHCSFSKGSSGGAIIRGGKLIGLVSFMETGQSGFAFGIPATLFRHHVQKYIETDDAAHLMNLKSADEKAIRFWNLGNAKL